MKNLLIVAHGSRREESNLEIQRLAKKVAAGMPPVIDDVLVAFLELASPSIDEAINSCFTRGAKEIIVLPYFLSAGNHVVEDIPREISKAMEKWPDKKIMIPPYIGAADEMPNLISKCCGY